jgi:ABC-type multidrug transport system ATPase subunit
MIRVGKRAKKVMKFYEDKGGINEVRIPEDAEFPCVLLSFDEGWNDYGIYSQVHFNLLLRKKDPPVVSSYIKVLRVNPKKEGSCEVTTVLNFPFETLSEDFCSLGQESDYYEELFKLGVEVWEPVLLALQDAAYLPLVADRFRHIHGFSTSIIRFTEAKKMLKEGRRILTGKKPLPKNFHFSFSCKLPAANSPHVVDFDFSSHPSKLNRTFVLVGRNGTGKTQFLAILAKSVSGLIEDDESEFLQCDFKGDRPLLAPVIAVSYSAFDDFHRPPNGKDHSYVYCGIRKGDGESGRFLSSDELRRRLVESLQNIKRRSLFLRWRKAIETVLENTLTLSDEDLDGLDFYNELSSGQRILVAVMTEIIRYIKPQSLILFDEPELHLHPEILAALARSLDELLHDNDSYAVIATHSSLLLQETLARQVRIFERVGNEPIVKPLAIESFGENLSAITREVFKVDGNQNNFRKVIDRLYLDLTKEEIEGLFEGGLPLLASSYLNSLPERDF